MKKNVASQVIGAQMVSASDGSAFTGSVTVYVTGNGGTQAAGSVSSGACTHEGNGFHTYVPAQAETNYDHIAFTFVGTGAIPATVQVYPTFPQTVDNATNISAIKTKTDYLPSVVAGGSGGVMISGTNSGTTTLGALTITGATTHTGATTYTGAVTASNASNNFRINGVVPGASGGLFIAGTNAATTVTTSFTTTFTGNLTGSVASVSGSVGSVLGGIDTTSGTTKTFDALQTAMNSAHGAGSWATATGFSTHSASDVWSVGSRVLTANTNLNDPTAAAIADAVWDEAIAGHAGAGSTGEALSAAGAAGDPWITALPGSYSSGQAGKIVGDYLNASITSRMATYTQPTGFLAATFPGTVASTTNITAGTITTVTNLTNAPTAGDLTATMKASVTTAATAATPTAAAVTGNVGGNVAGSVGSVTGAVGSVTGLTASDVGSIKAKTDSLTFTVAGEVDANIKSVNDTTVTGDGGAGTEWGP